MEWSVHRCTTNRKQRQTPPPSPPLQGLPGKVVKDWLRDAKGRLLVEQAVRAMAARSALLNSSLI